VDRARLARAVRFAHRGGASRLFGSGLAGPLDGPREGGARLPLCGKARASEPPERLFLAADYHPVSAAILRTVKRLVGTKQHSISAFTGLKLGNPRGESDRSQRFAGGF